MANWATQIAEEARRVGLDLVGICGPAPSEGAVAALHRWLEAGFAADMVYMRRPGRVARLVNPNAWEHPFRALIVAAAGYEAPPANAGSVDPSRARIAAYACRRDYHRVLADRLAWLARRLEPLLGYLAPRTCVDTAPLLERDAAQRAGLGFIGRNTMLIHPQLGSWLLLGEILVDRPLPVEPRVVAGTCGTCRRCLDVCPTGALVAPYLLDSRRCISYLTIEHRGPIPLELRPKLGNWIFGCDLCNLVCPYNRRQRRSRADVPAYHERDETTPAAEGPDADWRTPQIDPHPPLTELLTLDDAALLARFQGTPLRRAGRSGLWRNLCIAAGNWAAPELAPLLAKRLSDPDPLVRRHAAWALGRIDQPIARGALAGSLERESDSEVREEISLALGSP